MMKLKILIFRDYKCELTMTFSVTNGQGVCVYSSVPEEILICLN
jgi:hypothetical protein